MKTQTGFADHSIAYALASGMVVLDDSAALDREIERRARRMRRLRRAK